MKKKKVPDPVKTYFFLLGGLIGFALSFLVMFITWLLDQMVLGFILSFILGTFGYILFMIITNRTRAILEEWEIVERI